MFEHKRQPLLSARAFTLRLLRSIAVASAVIFGSLGLGVLGYHVVDGMPWLDALLNASMILSGMGPVGELHTVGGKLFASAYALYSGVVFITSTAILFAPIYHRFLHRFHLEIEESDADEPGAAEKRGRRAR